MSYRDDLTQDLRYAARQIRRAPATAALIIATLAIGIGTNVTMAGAIDRLLLRAPDHLREPQRLVRLLIAGPDYFGALTVGTYTNYTMFLDLEREVPAFESIAGYSSTSLSFGVGRDAEEVSAKIVSPSFFRTLGPIPELGRFFSVDDGFPPGESGGGPAMVVLSYEFWQRKFGGQRDVLGHPVRIGQLTYAIIGVAPRGFRGVEEEPADVWLPAPVAAPTEMPSVWYASRGSAWVSLIGRLKAGVSRAVAEQQTAVVFRRYEGGPYGFTERHRAVAASVIRGRGPDAPRDVRVTLWLSGVSVLVLLIACANIANLLLARALTRGREMAVRIALGARRGRLARQMLTESLLLATLGGVAALYLAALGDRALTHVLFGSDGAGGTLDYRRFLVAGAITLGTGALITLAPLIQSTGVMLTGLTRGGATLGRRGARMRTTLVVTQAALCTILLIAATLFAVSLGRVKALDLGLDVDHTMMARFNIVTEARPRSEIDARYETMLERVRAIPGVRGAVLVSEGGAIMPYTEATRHRSWWDMSKQAGYLTGVDHGHFRTLGAASLRGRDFDERDRPGAPQVAIVTEPLAQLLWGTEDPLGRCVMVPERNSVRRNDCLTVVGVVGGFWSFNMLRRDAMIVYVPRVQRPRAFARPQRMYISASGSPEVVAGIAGTVRTTIQSLRPDLPAVSMTLMRDRADDEMRPWRLAAMMFSLFGVVALVIAVIGVWSVVSFEAMQRAREVAIRIVLGARPSSILAVVAGRGLGALVAGLMLGMSAALVVAKWLGAMLFQTSPRDPRIIIGVGALLLGAGVLAGVIPTLRLLRRPVAASLRVE